LNQYQYLGNETYLHIITRKIGKVLQVELFDTYASKTTGPWVRLLVRDIEKLPQKIIIQRESLQENLEHKLLFSSLSNQCN
jgi:hypothetical protein